MALVVKNPPANAGDVRDVGSTPGLGRSPGVGNGSPFHYSCLENPMDKGAWWATVHGVSKSGTQLKGPGTHTQISGHTHSASWVKSQPTTHSPLTLPELRPPHGSPHPSPGSRVRIPHPVDLLPLSQQPRSRDWSPMFCPPSGAHQWAEFRGVCQHAHRHVQQPGAGLLAGVQSSAGEHQAGGQGHPRVDRSAPALGSPASLTDAPGGAPGHPGRQWPYCIYDCNIALIFPPPADVKRKEKLW